MVTNRAIDAHPHTLTELCPEGSRLYASALRTGRVSRADVEAAPCLMEFALLHPDPDDANWLRHSLAYRQDDGSVRLDAKPVKMGPYIPMERKY